MEGTELIRDKNKELIELERHLSTVRLNILVFIFGILVGVLTNLIAAYVPSVYVSIL